MQVSLLGQDLISWTLDEVDEGNTKKSYQQQKGGTAQQRSTWAVGELW